MRSSFCALVGALCLLGSSSPALAQFLTDNVAKACAGYTYATPVDRLGSCTSVIEGSHRSQQARAWALAYRAGAYYELHKFEPALADANQAVALWPERLQGFVIRAATLTALGRTDEALADLDKVVAGGGGYSAFLARATARDARREYDLALADYTKALQSMPNSPSALMGRGTIYNAQKRYADAAKDFSLAISSAPQEPLLLIRRAVAFDGLGRRDDALADLHRAAKVLRTVPEGNPGIPRRWLELGEALSNLGDYPAAIAAADRLIALAPNAESYNARCWRRMVANTDLAVARADCDQAVALSNKSAGALDSRAFVRFRAGDYAGAIDDADVALSTAPNQASTLLARGLALAALGRRERADADIAAAETLQPGILQEFARYGVHR